MALRFCHRCASEVEDVGGFCLLGHPLRLEPPIPSVAHIRDEVSRAFDEAGFEGPIEVLHVATAAASGHEPRPGRGSGGDVASPRNPASVLDPPPPPAERATVWEALGEGLDPHLTDPIAAFAPPSRMDWGPERPGLLDMPLRRRERPATA